MDATLCTSRGAGTRKSRWTRRFATRVARYSHCTGSIQTTPGTDVPENGPARDPFDFPRHWEADVVLSDGGTVHLRPITPDDGDQLREFHGRLSERTRYFR